MSDAAAKTIYLKDYRAPAYLVDDVYLTFDLDASATRVKSRISFRPNLEAPGPFTLDGEHMTLISASIDGVAVEPEVTATGLTCPVPDAPFIWEAEVEIDPSANTALEGLYVSGDMFSTQCEAEGFRRITYYPDRPDVMAPFTVRINSDLPVLLSNGNPVAKGDGWAEWHDPWPKPSYLFALVAGDLVPLTDSFRTFEGRDVELNVWVRPGPDEGKCAWAMDSLKRSMKWEEEKYGRAYDLDIFNIVAVNDFNAGAMENKGLNIFNSALVLASPETATDADFERIEGVVAHEYFHNWTGNRITCRDWFQLCLKEGLTVFRDQEFTSDMRSAPVKRIDDVLMLRGRQFREDTGPLAHPPRPDSFVEINNFYTATVYEKGAEIVGMLKRLVGEQGYADALQLYFDRHDGDAATVEDWIKVFEDACGRDLSQFKHWYTDAGIPRVSVTDAYDDGTYTLTFEQSTPGQEDKPARVIPLAVGLLNPNGDEVVPTTMLEMTEARQSFSFNDLASKPVPSILRGFSAPVILQQEVDDATRAFLLTHDTDPFNKWEAARNLAQSTLVKLITNGTPPSSAYLDGVAALARDESLDPAFRAVALALPSDETIAQALFEGGSTPDPRAIWDAR
jgi:aminopeptidase N